MNNAQRNRLEQLAVNIRLGAMRAFRTRGFGHVGGALSIADLLAVLYGSAMRYDPARPDWPERDKLVCSKGHAGPAVYAALALSGYFPMDWLDTLNQPETRLPSHCDHRRTPGIDMTTGSLGQGFSTAVGLALGDRLKGRDNQVYLVVGDGELNEGQVWEAAQFAAHHKLDNLIAFCDHNGKQLDGPTREIIAMDNIAGCFTAFGWDTQTIDGQDVAAIGNAVETARQHLAQPHMVVLETTKGAGVTRVARMDANHHIAVPQDLADEAMAELQAELFRLQQEGVRS
jgi:transketolase